MAYSPGSTPQHTYGSTAQPSIGRIVLYKKFDSSCPAIITNVWGNDVVNLRIFEDGSDTPWATMIQYGDKIGQWSWPPRV